jgi:hypothetical protein
LEGEKVESRVEWLKRQISTIERELKELRDGYNAHSHPGRARRLGSLLNSHRRELAATKQEDLWKSVGVGDRSSIGWRTK